MYSSMKEWTDIRLRVLREEATKREILRETGMHWTTLEKILRHPEPAGYRMLQERPKPKIGPFLERISDIHQSDWRFQRSKGIRPSAYTSESKRKGTRANTRRSRKLSGNSSGRAERFSCL